MIGVALISVAAEGFLFTKVPIPVRVLSGAAALLLISSEPISDVVGLVVTVSIVLLQHMLAKRKPLAGSTVSDRRPGRPVGSGRRQRTHEPCL